MSCFWDSLVQKLGKEDMQQNNIQNPQQLVDYLKKNNSTTDNVLWNNERLSQKQKLENKEHIINYDKNTISQGYLCSTCDPFLLLLCELFQITIQNNFNGNQMTYTHQTTNNYEIHISNNSSHMS
jgi:hypothetical protein